MPGRLDFQLQTTGLMDGARFGVMSPLVGQLAMERGMKSAAGVISRQAVKNARQRVRAQSGNLFRYRRQGYHVRGSFKARHIPSARLTFAPHWPLLEFGHRVVNRGGDTGKRAQAFNMLRDANQTERAKAQQALSRTLERALERVQIDAVRGGLRTQRAAENFVRRVLRREVDARERRRR